MARRKYIKKVIRFFLKTIGLRKSWFEKCIEIIKSQTKNFNDYDVLDVFAGDGSNTVRYYYGKVRYAELWDIDESLVARLREKYPKFKSKTTNSFNEIENHSKKYDLVISDNNIKIYGDWCENFEIFDKIPYILKNSAFVIINVFPTLSDELKDRYSEYFTDEHIHRRMVFYQVENGDQIPLDTLVIKYTERFKNSGYIVENHWIIQRPEVVNSIFSILFQVIK